MRMCNPPLPMVKHVLCSQGTHHAQRSCPACGAAAAPVELKQQATPNPKPRQGCGMAGIKLPGHKVKLLDRCRLNPYARILYLYIA